MPNHLVRRRRSAAVQPTAYRPCSNPEASTRTLTPVAHPTGRVARSRAHATLPRADDRLRAPAHLGAGMRQTDAAEADSTIKSGRIAQAYNKLTMEHALLTSADPGAWLQRSIDRADDGDAVVDLIKALRVTQHDIDRIEASLLQRPESQQTASRWMLRLHHADIDNSVRVMGEMTRAKADSVENGTPYQQALLGQIPVGGMRIVHASWRCATWVDMSYKGLSDDHLHTLLPLLEGFGAMQFLDLSHNAITDAHMSFLAALLCERAALQGLNLAGNPITERGIADFNTVSLCDGPDTGLRMRGDLQAFKHTADPTLLASLRAQQSAVFEITFGTALRVACGRAETGAQVVHALAAERGALRHVVNLDLSGKRWQLADIRALGDLLARDGMHLWHLDFTDSTLPEGGVAALAQALGHAHRLISLRLTDLPIDAAGDAGLHALVRSVTTLTHIAASNIPLTEAELWRRSGYAVGRKPAAVVYVPSAPMPFFPTRPSGLQSDDLYSSK